MDYWGISFVCNNIADYGGDPDLIYLMGQSAGAHIASCALLQQAMRESRQQVNISWSVSQIKAYFGLSGGYNLFNLVDHFHNRGLYRSLFLRFQLSTSIASKVGLQRVFKLSFDKANRTYGILCILPFIRVSCAGLWVFWWFTDFI